MSSGTLRAMQRGEKIDHARRYCCELVAAHAAISGLALGGSVATGNDLPISDLDLWCFVDQAAPDLPIDKHYAKGVYVDISQYPASLLRATDALADPYFSCARALRETAVSLPGRSRLAMPTRSAGQASSLPGLSAITC